MRPTWKVEAPALACRSGQAETETEELRSISGCAAPLAEVSGVVEEAPPGAAVEGDALCAQKAEIAPGGDQHRNLGLLVK
jgi:hypothetical protein